MRNFRKTVTGVLTSVLFVFVSTLTSTGYAQEGAAPADADAAAAAASQDVVAAAEEQIEAAFTVLGPTFRETPWYGWLILLGSIFVALLIGRIVQSSLRAMAARCQADRKIRATVLRDIAKPLSLAILTVGLTIGLVFIYTEPSVDRFMRGVITLLFLLSIGWCFYNLVDVVEELLASMGGGTSPVADRMIVQLVGKSLRIFLVVIFTLVVAQNVFGLNVTGWLAGLGIVGLGVSLASQDSVKNFFGSITVFLDRPFTVGDVINFAGATGSVEEIGLRSTRIRVPNGNLITVPNMKFIDGTVENISRRPSIRRDLTVTIKHEPTRNPAELVDVIRSVLQDAQVVEEGQFDMTGNPPVVYLDSFNGDSLVIKGSYWYQVRGDAEREKRYFQHVQLVNQKLLATLEGAQIAVKQIA